MGQITRSNVNRAAISDEGQQVLICLRVGRSQARADAAELGPGFLQCSAVPQSPEHLQARTLTPLRGQGIDFARRTVTKYREMLGVGSSTQRKRLF